jgi:hypothetical protein
MATLRYAGDVRDTLPAVLGGRYQVVDTSYDKDDDETVVTVRPLIDPLTVLEQDE